jgi:hypothetical protein
MGKKLARIVAPRPSPLANLVEDLLGLGAGRLGFGLGVHGVHVGLIGGGVRRLDRLVQPVDVIMQRRHVRLQRRNVALQFGHVVGRCAAREQSHGGADHGGFEGMVGHGSSSFSVWISLVPLPWREPSPGGDHRN